MTNLRAAAIQLAASLPKESAERKALLEALSSEKRANLSPATQKLTSQVEDALKALSETESRVAKVLASAVLWEKQAEKHQEEMKAQLSSGVDPQAHEDDSAYQDFSDRLSEFGHFLREFRGVTTPSGHLGALKEDLEHILRVVV